MPHLDETVSAVPGVSPGVVLNDEILLREVYEPQHVIGGDIQKSAIPVEDLIYRGLSCHRLQHVSRTTVEKSTNRKLSEKTAWRFVGLAKLKTGHVRSLQYEQERAFVVIDTASKENKSHASIFAAHPTKRTRSQARELRKLLLEFFREWVSLDSAFST